MANIKNCVQLFLKAWKENHGVRSAYLLGRLQMTFVFSFGLPAFSGVFACITLVVRKKIQLFLIQRTSLIGLRRSSGG